MELTLGIPQIILLVLLFIGLGVTAAKHGQPRKGTYNFGGQLIAVLIDIAILYFGGFFG